VTGWTWEGRGGGIVHEDGSTRTVTEGDTLRGLYAGLLCRRALAGLAGTALVAAAGTGVAGPAAAGEGTGEVYLVHGILGTPADVLMDGRRLAGGARPETVLGPVRLPAGQHIITLQAGARIVTSARFTVHRGQSLDLVAHRAANSTRTPQVVVFRNDLAPIGPGKARLVVGHTAVAPPADVRVNGSVLFHDVGPEEALSVLVPAKAYSVDVLASQGSGTVLGPVRVVVRAGTLTRVFAVGDPSDGTADAIVQVLPVAVVGAGRPRSVPTGDGGQAAEAYIGDAAARGAVVPAAVLTGGLGLLLLAGAGRRRLRRHER
jgi:hypothetical protein